MRKSCLLLVNYFEQVKNILSKSNYINIIHWSQIYLEHTALRENFILSPKKFILIIRYSHALEHLK